ncbi:hypothetical protein HMPREF1981_00172 [Bacteroides pyogenes F0041]|uniref:Uncharacterized protein n=1 Tax=Bacteroides pyogenes F0041 TaxID=1321819 RepID=U2CXX9_9BACE|nr:hypothetical protein HMPREF1981_00172 [Bacteroides pyogenes F0041]
MCFADYANLSEYFFRMLIQLIVFIVKVVGLSSVFYSSAVRQTNKTQTKDGWNTNGRRITF